MKPKISFVIPVYNSEKTLESVVCEIKETLSNSNDYDYEIILVDDGSVDNVYGLIESLSKENNKIKGINLSRNFGQHAALIAGFRYVTGEIIVCLDDDGQTPANECFKLISEIENGYDVVYARYDSKQHTLFRNFGSLLNNKMTCWLLDKPKDLYISSYFACRKFVIDEIIRYQNPYPYMQGLVLRSTRNIVNVDVKHRKRSEGTSNYSIKKLIGLYLNGFTAFSVKPLRFATILGLVCALAGFVYGIVLIIERIIGKIQVLGYSSNMATTLFIGGMIMIILGLIGEYIGRIYISINNSPQSVIKKTINIEKDNYDNRN